MTTSPQEKLLLTPDIPKEFGDDGGHFYKYYDELAEEIDEDLVNRLKARLDGILIFAGLFAGVNSAFLALTLPQMSPNPADDTNALLLRIAMGDNSTISKADLPSASFTPPARIYPVNALFSVSLSFALFSSFFAILGQQWLVYYRKRGGGGPESQRWEQLQRYLGARQWKLETILDDLVPSMLQLGLAIFYISFALYLGTLSHTLNRIIVASLCVAGATLVALAACVTFDPWCPFNVPLSRIVRPVVCATAAVVRWLGMCGGAAAAFILTNGIVAGRSIMRCFRPNTEADGGWEHVWRSELEGLVQAWRTGPADTYREFSKVALRSPKRLDKLKIIALQRVMCTSEDRSAWYYSALNLQSIRDQRALSSLAKDSEFCTRLIRLYQAALEDAQRGQTGSPDARKKAIELSGSFSHLLLMASSVPILRWSTVGTNPSQIVHLGNLPISPSQIRDLNRGNSISPTPSPDESSDCANLRFCISVFQLLVEGFKDPQPTSFEDAFTGIVESLKKAEDLRLGCVVASVILSSKEWCEEDRLDIANWPRSELLQKLLNAYRTRDEWAMFETISEALKTASAEWEVKPNNEIYTGLSKLRLSRFDASLLSIERRIRDKNTSETDRQGLRDEQAQCVRSVADSVSSPEYSFQRNLIDAPLERYLDSIKELRGLDPTHFENSGTMAFLRVIESTFWRSQDGAAEQVHEQQNDPQNEAYLKLRQLLHPRSDTFNMENATQVAEDHNERGRHDLSEIAPNAPTF